MQTPTGIIDDSIIALLENEEILVKMSEAKSPEECYDVVKDSVTVSFEEFVEMMTIGKSTMEKMQEGLLSEEDLNAVAGGKTAHEIGGIVQLSSVGAVGIILIAATSAVS